MKLKICAACAATFRPERKGCPRCAAGARRPARTDSPEPSAVAVTAWIVAPLVLAVLCALLGYGAWKVNFRNTANRLASPILERPGFVYDWGHDANGHPRSLADATIARIGPADSYVGAGAVAGAIAGLVLAGVLHSRMRPPAPPIRPARVSRGKANRNLRTKQS